MSELKNCPFCGGKAELISNAISSYVSYGCPKCYIKTGEVPCTDFVEIAENRNDWNSRVEDED